MRFAPIITETDPQLAALQVEQAALERRARVLLERRLRERRGSERARRVRMPVVDWEI